MAKFTITNFRGLTTNVDLLEAPAGGLTNALNVSLERPGALQPRRGIDSWTTVSSFKDCHRLWEFTGIKMGHFDDDSTGWRVLWYDSGGGGWTAVSSTDMRHPDNTGEYKLSEVELNDWLYLTEYQGIRRQRSASALDGFAGVAKCPDLDRANSTNPDTAGGVLAPQKQRSYKALIEIRKNDGDRPLTGSPSGRMTLQNTNATGGNSKAPTIRVLLPKAVNTGSTSVTALETWVQLYASSITDDLTIPPLEDFALIYDHQVTSTNVTNGYVDIPDTTPDALRGRALYTNPSQEGVLQANEPPPFAYCIAKYKDCLVAANTIGRHRFELQILAVGGSNGIQDTDVINIEPVSASLISLTAKTSPTLSTHYQLETSGSLSTSQQIEYTAQNLCAAINRQSANTSCYAYYAGIPDDPRSLGKIIIENRIAGYPANGGESFKVYVGSGDKQTCFEPQLPTSSSAYVMSLADEWPNGWAISKRGGGDYWPLLQNGRMGRGAVIAIASMEDACFFFHDSGDVWRMTGDPPTPFDPGSLTVEPWRENLELFAANTIQQMDGRLIAWTNQGVVSITPSGYEILSNDITGDLSSLVYTIGKGNLRLSAWSAVDPVSRRYMFGVTSGTNRQWIYYAQVGGWTTADRAFSAGFYSREDDQLYFGEELSGAGTTAIYREIQDEAATGIYDDDNEAIVSTITFPPFVIDGGETAKQLREVIITFESNQPSTSLSVSIATEHTTVAVTVATLGTNIARCPVPSSVQRGARHTITINLDTGAALARWRISSISYLYRAYSERASK